MQKKRARLAGILCVSVCCGIQMVSVRRPKRSFFYVWFHRFKRAYISLPQFIWSVLFFIRFFLLFFFRWIGKWCINQCAIMKDQHADADKMLVLKHCRWCVAKRKENANYVTSSSAFASFPRNLFALIFPHVQVRRSVL